MKQKLATALLTLLSTCAFAQDAITPPAPITTTTAPAAVETMTKKSFWYIRMGASPVQGVGTLPGLGIGYRLISNGSSAVDLSTSFNTYYGESARAAIFTFPRANYLYYWTPAAASSVYFGGGLAWGGIEKRVYDEEDDYTDSDFAGIIANLAVGYEMHRSSAFCTFVQLDVNQPTIAAASDASFPSPSAELAVGIGF